MAGRMRHCRGRGRALVAPWALALVALLAGAGAPSTLAADWEGGGGAALAEAEDPEHPTMGPERVVFQVGPPRAHPRVPPFPSTSSSLPTLVPP